MYLIYARIKYIVYVRALSVHIYAHSVDTYIRAFSGYVYTRIQWIRIYAHSVDTYIRALSGYILVFFTTLLNYPLLSIFYYFINLSFT
jgi:hypothetical protein